MILILMSTVFNSLCINLNNLALSRAGKWMNAALFGAAQVKWCLTLDECQDNYPLGTLDLSKHLFLFFVFCFFNWILFIYISNVIPFPGSPATSSLSHLPPLLL